MAEITFPASVKVKCDCCGKEVTRYKSALKHNKHIYCSKQCRRKLITSDPNCVCSVCGIPLHIKVSRLIKIVNPTCSKKCMGIFQRSRVDCQCKRCGKYFYRTTGQIEEGRGVYCSRACQLASYCEKDNPNWRGGIESHHKYRSRKASLPATLTDDEWKQILESFDYKCAYCGIEQSETVRLNKEHIVPVSRGGAYTKDNIVPACKWCNSKKHTRTPEEAGMTIYARAT